jgi:hypothetical protein
VAALGIVPLFTQLPRAKFFSVFSEIKVSERSPCNPVSYKPIASVPSA